MRVGDGVEGHGGFRLFWLRVTACHVVTYMAAGLLAYSVLRYRALFQAPDLVAFLRSTDSKWVAAGPALQVVRGLVIAAALYPFRNTFLLRHRGWLMLAGLLIGLSELSASGAAPGSLEGVIYTRLSFLQHVQGLPEVVLQNAAFAGLLCGWYRRPGRVWDAALLAGTMLSILMSVAGIIAAK